MSKENDTFIINWRCRQRKLVCLANSVDYQIWPTGFPVALLRWPGPGWPGWVASGGASGTTGRSGRPDNALPHGLHKVLERRPFPMWTPNRCLSRIETAVATQHDVPHGTLWTEEATGRRPGDCGRFAPDETNTRVAQRGGWGSKNTATEEIERQWQEAGLQQKRWLRDFIDVERISLIGAVVCSSWQPPI